MKRSKIKNAENLTLQHLYLFCWGGHCCPVHWDLFKTYCASPPPNLGIKTWICRINFAQRPFFQAWDSLTSLKSQTRDPQLKVLPGWLVLRIFTSWKNLSTSAGFEPANLGSRGKHVTPRPQRQTLNWYTGLFCKTFMAILLHNSQKLLCWKKVLDFQFSYSYWHSAVDSRTFSSRCPWFVSLFI